MRSFRQLLRLAWPIAVARSTQAAIGVSDVLLVSHLGEDALAATTIGAFDVTTALLLPIGTVSIVSSFASQLHAANDHAAARRHAVYGLGVAVLTQLCALLAIPLVPSLLAPLGYADAVRAPMAGYVAIRLASAGAAVGLDALAEYYCGVGRTALPMLASTFAMLLNIAGNWLFIDGHCGFPRLGVAGSALAGTIAVSLAFVLLLAVFLLRGGTAVGPLAATEFARFLRVGLPMGANWLVEIVAFSLFIHVLGASFGTTTLAAFMTILQINAFTALPSFALASAGAIVVGHAIGAGAVDEVPRLVRRTVVAVVTWQGGVAVIYFIGARAVLRPFFDGADVAELIEIGSPVLVISAAWMLLDVIAASYTEALRAAGDTTMTLGIRVGLSALVFAPGTWLLVVEMRCGRTEALIWLTACVALLAAALAVRFRRGAWSRVRLV